VCTRVLQPCLGWLRAGATTVFQAALRAGDLQRVSGCGTRPAYQPIFRRRRSLFAASIHRWG